jgi:tetracycline repressor-like protein
LLNDLSDPTLRRHLLRMSRRARAWYEQLLTEAIASGELRGVTDVHRLGRLIEATLRGSFLGWSLYREGDAADWLRADLNALLRPYLTRGGKHRRR